MQVQEIMTSNPTCCGPDEDVESCCNKMEEKQVRRAVVTDDTGKCCGIVAQADVAQEADGKETAELVQKVSRAEKRSGCC